MTDDLEERSRQWAKANRKQFARNFCSLELYSGEKSPVAVFMAGSPGAGKTEASKALAVELGGFLRIDPDEFRSSIPGYDGANSHLIQRAVSTLVDAVLDVAFDRSQSFLLDGTLSSLNVAEKNVQRCLNKGRGVQILYVYQEPNQAWDFVQAREMLEGRRIPPERFVHQFFESRKVVDQLKAKFGKDISVDVLLKNVDGTPGKYFDNVRDLASVAPLRYTEEDVQRIVSLF